MGAKTNALRRPKLVLTFAIEPRLEENPAN
jgi:hypothetical protein